MATGDKFVNIAQKRLLGFLDFKDRWLDYFKKIFEDITENAFGQNGFFNTVVTMSAFGVDKIQLDNDVVGTDAAGHFMVTSEKLAGRSPSASGIQVENLVAVTYSVALIYSERPDGIQINPRTGFPEFLTVQEHIGVRDEPDVVTDNGDGTMTFRVNSVARPFPDDVSNAHLQVGRTVVVWKKSPGKTAVTEGLAILEGTVANVAGNNEITVTGTFGQVIGAASTNTSDYFVLLEGPTVSRQDLSVEPFTLFVGTFVGTGAGNPPGTFVITGQNTLGPVAADLGQVTAPHHGNLQIQTRADGADVNQPQIEALNAAAASVFSVDEDGDTLIDGTLDVNGAVTFDTLTVLNNANLGDADADQHTVKGGVDFRTTASALLNQILGGTGEVGLGGAALASHSLKTYGDTNIGDDELDDHEIVGDTTWLDNALNELVKIWGAFPILDIDAPGTPAGYQLRVNQSAAVNQQLRLGVGYDGGTINESERPRMQFGPLNSLGNVQTLAHIIGFAGVTLGRQIRIHSSKEGDTLWITINAEWDWSGVFFKDQNNDLAIGLKISCPSGTTGRVALYMQDPTNNSSWAPGSWDVTLLDWNMNTPSLRGEATFVSDITLVSPAELTAGGLITANGGLSVLNGTDFLVATSFKATPSVVEIGPTGAADLYIYNDLVMQVGSGQIKHFNPGGELSFGNDGRFIASNLRVDNQCRGGTVLADTVLYVGSILDFSIKDNEPPPGDWATYTGQVTEMGNFNDAYPVMINNDNAGLAVGDDSTPVTRICRIIGSFTLTAGDIAADGTLTYTDTFTPQDGPDVVVGPGQLYHFILASSAGGMIWPDDIVLAQPPYVTVGTNQIRFHMQNTTNAARPTGNTTVNYSFLYVRTT
jgi:hypothetical protein